MLCILRHYVSLYVTTMCTSYYSVRCNMYCLDNKELVVCNRFDVFSRLSTLTITVHNLERTHMKVTIEHGYEGHYRNEW